MTCDCLLAQAPICDPCGRDLKYGSLSSRDIVTTLPSAVTWRCMAYQGKTAHTRGLAAMSLPLREVRLL
jgi:hypothetical protein